MKSVINAKDSNFVGGELTICTFRKGILQRHIGPIPNKVVSSSGGYGRNIIARQLIGDTTYPIEIDSVALGDGATAPADANTGLGNSLVSGLSITEATVSNNVVTIKVFAADIDLPDDTYSEFGLFCNGRLFARILITPSYTKETGEDTLFVYELTLAG